MGNHTILFIFDNEEEVEKILEGEPWSFDKHLVMIKQYDYSIPVQDLVFEHVTLWVQVHDIPTNYLSRKIAEKLCEAARKVSTEPTLAEVDRGNVMRIRVTVDTTLPLCRGRVFTLEDGSKGWASFKYERLPNVCYWCGRLDHFYRDCDRWIQSSGILTKQDQEYGSWIRASPLPAFNNSLVVVPGYYEARKKEIENKGDRRKNSNMAAEKVAKGGSLMEDRSGAINDPIIREEDVMEVTKQRGTTDENLEPVQMEKGAKNQGDYFKKKIKEIDLELMKFELKKDSGNVGAVNVESVVDLESKTGNCGDEQTLSRRGLEACEQLNENNSHVPKNVGNPRVQVTHVLGKTQVPMASSNPTWKRIERKEASTTRVAIPLKSLKRSGAKFLESEPRKKIQVSRDDQEPTIEVARAENQSRQEP